MNPQAETRFPSEPASAKLPSLLGRTQHIKWGDFVFDSKHEAACALLLRRYVSGYEIIPGETAQVRIPHGYVDFCVNGALVEFHPIILACLRTSPTSTIGVFSTWKEYQEYRSQYKALLSDPAAARDFKRSVEIPHEQAYAQKRTELIREKFPDREIIFTYSPEEFYLKVIARFGEAPPRLEQCINMFWALRRGLRATPTRHLN